ncbi:MAG: acyl carrier protein [Pseudomonadota bacterium]
MVEDIIKGKIIRIVASQLGLGEEDVQLGSSISVDLGADSLDIVELRLAIEEEFGLELDDDSFGEVDTVSDLIKLISMRAT